MTAAVIAVCIVLLSFLPHRSRLSLSVSPDSHWVSLVSRISRAAPVAARHTRRRPLCCHPTSCVCSTHPCVHSFDCVIHLAHFLSLRYRALLAPFSILDPHAPTKPFLRLHSLSLAPPAPSSFLALLLFSFLPIRLSPHFSLYLPSLPLLDAE